MDLIGAIGNGVGFIGSLQDSLKKEADRDVVAQPLGDTISISQEAKEKLKIQTAGETADKEQNSSEGNSGSSGSGSSVASAKGTSDDTTDPVKELQQQIKEVQEKLKEAQERLQEAEAEQTASKKKNPDSAILAGDEESPEVKSARAEVDQLNAQLMRLNEELRKAMGASVSVGGGGLLSGVPTGSIGAPVPSKSHIGEATDPYAAAAAAEAVEMGRA